MTPHLRACLVVVTAASVITGLWSFTASVDEDWALWRRYTTTVAALNVVGTLVVLGVTAVLVARENRRLRLMRVVTSGFALIGCVGLLELPAVAGYDYGRLFGTNADDTWLQIATRGNRADPELVRLRQPHSRYEGWVYGNLVARLSIPNPEPYHVDVAYDRHGFRNSTDLERADIAAIGDSFVEGAETPTDEIVTSVIGTALNSTVANLGQSAYGPQQEAIVLERFGMPLNPRTVVWFFFGGNDLADAGKYESYKQNPSSLMPSPPFVERSFVRNALWSLSRLTTPVRRHGSPTSRNHAARFRTREGKDVTLYFEGVDGPFDARQWRLASTALRRAADTAARGGADFLLVYVPRKFQVYRDLVSGEPGSVATTWQPSTLAESVEAWCRQENIEFLDATRPLRRAAVAGGLVYLPDDVHWTVEGHRVVGEAVASRLKAGKGGVRPE